MICCARGILGLFFALSCSWASSHGQSCGGVVSSLEGKVFSPGFNTGNHYGNNQSCSWTVIVPAVSTTIVSFTSMDLEDGWDYVYIYRSTTRDSHLLANYTGNDIPYESILETSFLLVFESDGTISKQGFSVEFHTYQGRPLKFKSSIPDDHQNVAAIKGDNVIFRCDVVADSEPVIEWRKNGIVIGNGALTFSGQGAIVELLVPYVNEIDAGWYTCRAGNYLGSIRRSFQLTVQVPPVVINNPVSIVFERIENATFQAVFRCDVYGIPTPYVTWKKNGTPLQMTTYIQGTPWLKLQRVTFSDFGNYSCYAKNTVGEVESRQATLTGLSTTRANSYFRYSGSYGNEAVNIEQTANIYYNIQDDFGLLTVRQMAVYKDGNFLNTSTDRRVYSYNSRYSGQFSISSVRQEDSGVYEIKWLTYGFSWFTGIIVRVPPHASVQSKDVIRRKFQETVTITCESVSGNPNPTFDWYRQDQLISSGWVGHLIQFGYARSYLTLTEDTLQQQAYEYSCVATNPAGSSTASVNISVEVVQGWIESDRGSQCSPSCRSDYGVVLIQRSCISMKRCSGPSVFTQPCVSVKRICTTDEPTTSIPIRKSTGTRTPPATTPSTTRFRTDMPSTTNSGGTETNIRNTDTIRKINEEQNDELSRGAVAGVSVIGTAIVAIVFSVILLLVIMRRLRRSSEDTTGQRPLSQNIYSNPPFRVRTIALPNLPSDTATSVEETEMKTEDECVTDDSGEKMRDSPAYATTGCVKKAREGVSSAKPIYETSN